METIPVKIESKENKFGQEISTIECKNVSQGLKTVLRNAESENKKIVSFFAEVLSQNAIQTEYYLTVLLEKVPEQEIKA